MSKAKMRGHIGTGGRCHAEGHGDGCELTRETHADRVERAREKRQWLREVWSPKVRDWDAKDRERNPADG